MTTQYDAVAQEYAQRIAPKYRPVAQLAADRAVLPSTGLVVELAIGTGLLASLVLPATPADTRYLGVDVAVGMLAVARISLPDAGLVAADVRALPLRDGAADLVLSSLGPVQDSPEALREAHRILGPGGSLLAVTWGPTYGELDLLQSVRTRLGAGDYDVATPDRLRDRVRDAGFVSVGVEVVRLDVVHDSLDEYVSYRAAFGRIPWLTAETEPLLPAALRGEAARYVDARGRVCMDWSFSVITAQRAAD